MHEFRDQAVVLQHRDLGEADRILVLLTRDNGIVSAVAKGIRKTNSRFGARLESLTLVDAMLYRGRSLATVTSAHVLAAFGQTVSADLDRFASASAMAEFSLKICSDDPNSQQFALLVAALKAMAEYRAPATELLDSFLLRSLALAGWQLNLRECSGCGANGNLARLSIAGGGISCLACAAIDSVEISTDCLQQLQALQLGNWQQVAQASASIKQKASNLVAEYANWQLAKPLKAMRVMAGAAHG